MERVADRLKTALDYRDKSRRWLHLRLTERKVRGASYASVYSYVRGDPDRGDLEPPLEFIRATAELLDVRLAWLVDGEGTMTKERRADTLDGAIAEVLEDDHWALRGLPHGVVPAFTRTLRQYVLQIPGGRHLAEVEGGKEQIDALALDLGDLLKRPLSSWGFVNPYLQEYPVYADPTVDVEHYCRIMLQMLSYAMRPEDKGEPLDLRPRYSSISQAVKATVQGRPTDALKKQLAELKALQARLHEARRVASAGADG